MIEVVDMTDEVGVELARRFYTDAVKRMEGGDQDTAAQIAHEALRIFEREEGLDSPSVARTLNVLSWIYAALGRGIRAEAMARRATKIMERLERQFGPCGEELARIRVQALEALATARRLQGRYSAAEPIQQRCVELARETLGEGDLDHASALYGLGMLYRCQGRVDEAKQLFDEAEGVLDSRQDRLRKAS